MLWGDFEGFNDAVAVLQKQQMQYMAIAMRMAQAEAKDFSKWIDDK